MKFYTYGLFDEEMEVFDSLEDAIEQANTEIKFAGDDAQEILVLVVGEDGNINEVYEEDVNEDAEPTWKLNSDHSLVNTLFDNI